MTPLPEEFLQRLGSYNTDIFSDFEKALTDAPSVSVRINPSKPGGFLTDGLRQVPWCNGGFYLDNRPSFTLDPALHAGRYYVQDASSMFISHALRQLVDKPVICLDACAAPGGKSLCAIDSLPEGSIVISNEAVPARAAVLRENIIKWGCPNSIVTRADARRFAQLRNTFDVITADVPCSGEGMMRKNSTAIGQWSATLVRECAALQREIVESLWPALRPGGLFIYSTCTFNRDENELIAAVINESLNGIPIDIPVDPSWNIAHAIDSPLPCLRFIPGHIRGEGLFMTAFRKPGEPARQKKNKQSCRPAKEPGKTAGWISRDSNLQINVTGDRITAFPPEHQPLLHELEKTAGIDIIHHGVTLGHIKGHDIIPAHSLALSTALNRDAFPNVEISRDNALSYLRCEPIALPSTTPRGYVLLTIDNTPIGLVKNLGNRVNTLYPRDWRIRNL